MRASIVTLLAVVALAGSGCSAMGSAAEFGATPGGVQDMGLARELIGLGQVPPAEAFVVEGMFSEHDLPLEGDRCETTLCLRTGMGVAPDEDDVRSTWLQVGFSSTIDPENYQRPTLTVIGVVDTSGSMTGTPLDVSKAMLNALIDQLGSNDRFGLVTYGTSVRTRVSARDADNRGSLHDSVDRMSTDGSTNMEGGLERAFTMAIEDSGDTQERRVWLFTDAQPNVGATSGTDFERMAATAAESGVGLTVFGVGMGLGQDIMVSMSHLRGGNAFSLFSADDATALMEESWPWMVCPIAYDFHATVAPEPGLDLVESYGIPAEDSTGTATLDVATIFLSRNRGAILARFLPWSADVLAGDATVQIDMTYSTPDGEEMIEHQAPSIPSASEADTFTQPIVQKTVALAVLVRSMRRAAEIYGADQAGAVALMERAHARVVADAAAIGDPALDPEVQLAADLLQLMRDGAGQGEIYSGSGYGY
jgi:Ca-activated chloride channel homolog